MCEILFFFFFFAFLSKWALRLPVSQTQVKRTRGEKKKMLTSRGQRGIFLLNAAGSSKDVLGLSGQCCSLFSPFRKCYTHFKDLFLWYENPGKSGCVTLNWAWWDTFVDKRVGESRSLPCAINSFHFEYTNTPLKKCTAQQRGVYPLKTVWKLKI